MRKSKKTIIFFAVGVILIFVLSTIIYCFMGEKNETAFLKCASSGNIEGVAYYLEQGMPIDTILRIYSFGTEITNSYRHGFTALHLAAENGKVKMTKYLLSKGANVNAYSTQGYTPIRLVVSAYIDDNIDDGIFLQLIDLMVDYGADCNRPTIKGMTPLEASLSKFNALKKLLEVGADPNAPNIEGFSPLHLVCIRNYGIQYAEVLLKAKADINVLCKHDARTPLHIAIDCGDFPMANYLAINGADINAKRFDGKTALELALSKKWRFTSYRGGAVQGREEGK